VNSKIRRNYLLVALFLVIPAMMHAQDVLRGEIKVELEPI
jgi:hypothetical protein